MTRPDSSFWSEQLPYSMAREEKVRHLSQALAELTSWHRSSCPKYARILDLLGRSANYGSTLEEIPFIPARLFKEHELSSIGENEIFKTLTSSGTSGQAVSRIFLDRETASLQTRILTRLMTDVLGKKRVPMLVIDSSSVLKDRQSFSARGAGILGFSLFGQDVTYALDANMNLDLPAIDQFLERHDRQPIFLFGFTFMIWTHFYRVLRMKNLRLALENGILMHGGGWKKLQHEAVGREQFSRAIFECSGISRVINYYGMVEQTGSIYLECEHGKLHTPVFSDIIVRDPTDFTALPYGKNGLVQVLSMIPRSYPGHSLLTEDLGRVDGEDDCPCGRLGKHFTILGRIAKAEARGCSDTYEQP